MSAVLGDTRESMVTTWAEWLRLHAKDEEELCRILAARTGERSGRALGCAFRTAKVELRNHLVRIPRFLLPSDPSNSGYSCNPAGF